MQTLVIWWDPSSSHHRPQLHFWLFTGQGAWEFLSKEGCGEETAVSNSSSLCLREAWETEEQGGSLGQETLLWWATASPADMASASALEGSWLSPVWGGSAMQPCQG